jgi:hypothetical protein
MGREELINKVYTDPRNPGSFSGPSRLYDEVKKLDATITRKEIDDFLEKNRTYTLFKQRKVNYDRSKIIPAGFLSDLHVDLGDFQSLARKNKGYKYLMVAVDTFSRRVFTAPIKSKNFLDVKDGFNQIFANMPYLPQQIFTDRGKEFESRDITQYFKEKGVQKFKAEASNIKAAFAERMIRSIKQRLYKFFSEKNSTNWLTAVPQIVEAINHSVCRSTGMRPVDINENNASEIWERLYAPIVRDPLGKFTIKKNKYKAGDTVRISRAKPIFEKGYLPTFSDELFKILDVSKARPPYYRLIDDKGEKIRGRFYEEELCKTDENTTFRIEKVLKKRTRNGVKELLVKFIDYKQHYWITENDIV